MGVSQNSPSRPSHSTSSLGSGHLAVRALAIYTDRAWTQHHAASLRVHAHNASCLFAYSLFTGTCRSNATLSLHNTLFCAFLLPACHFAQPLHGLWDALPVWTSRIWTSRFSFRALDFTVALYRIADTPPLFLFLCLDFLDSPLHGSRPPLLRSVLWTLFPGRISAARWTFSSCAASAGFMGS